jgi:hypothetical protein
VGVMDGGEVDGLFWIGLLEGCLSMYRVCRFGRGFGKVSKRVSRSGVAERTLVAELRMLVGTP